LEIPPILPPKSALLHKSI